MEKKGKCELWSFQKGKNGRNAYTKLAFGGGGWKSEKKKQKKKLGPWIKQMKWAL